LEIKFIVGEKSGRNSGRGHAYTTRAMLGCKAAANKVNIPNTSAFYWPKCSTFSVLTLDRSGNDELLTMNDERETMSFEIL
jgi:hypothetical protein